MFFRLKVESVNNLLVDRSVVKVYSYEAGWLDPINIFEKSPRAQREAEYQEVSAGLFSLFQQTQAGFRVDG